MKPDDKLRDVKRRYAEELLNRPGVCGVSVEGDETGHETLAIHLDTDDPEVRKALPTQIEGYPVKFVRSGPYQKY
jgi:hypothetical protein